MLVKALVVEKMLKILSFFSGFLPAASSAPIAASIPMSPPRATLITAP
jgi:hypothetical protein